ncbi:MAG: hypothetical protein MJZ02_09065 [Paludibacteraceae bacterium]|nr:hypothetical protein [Paludibacteraceae bacterium]
MNLGVVFAAARVFVGLVFIVSAILKFISFDNFKIAIDSFELYLYSLDWFPLTVCFYIARLLIGFEFALGLALVTNIYRKWVNLAAYAVLFLFSVFLVYLISIGYDGNCHCMGSYIDLPPIPSLVKNFVLALLVYLSAKGKDFSVPYAAKAVPVVSFVALVVMFIVSPPDGLAPTKEAEVHEVFAQNFIQNDSTYKANYANQPKTLVCLFSTGCRACKLSAKKLQLMVNRYGLPESKIYVLYFGDDHGRKVFEDFSGIGGKYNYSMLRPDEFGRMAGFAPVFMLFENGKLTKKYTYRTLNEDVISSMLE